MLTLLTRLRLCPTTVGPLPRKASTVRPVSPNTLAMTVYGDPKASKTVVFLHGIMGNKRNWRNPALMLVKSNPDLKCIAIDLRGHGDSQIFSGDNTVESCAADLHETFQQHAIHPTVLSAHSFGGKVALKYLEISKAAVQPPATTWILDSMPGLYSTDATKNSVIQVLNIVRKIPESFESRDWLLQFLINDNFLNKAVSQWLATNVITDKDGCHLGLNVPTIVELMTDFCNLDTWPILENFEEDVSIIYLRAGNNTNWSSDTLDRLRRIEKANNRIKLLEMPNVGHWLHAEDPSGLLELIKKHSIGIV